MPFQKEQTEKANRQMPKAATSTAKWNEVDNAISDFKSTFGFVPSFVKNIVDPALPGAWAEAKVLRFSPQTNLDTKLKGLIALGVAAQIPCEMINYFEQTATTADGATEQEQLEAVMMAGITRHWSTVLNGSQMEKVEFRNEVDKVMSFVKKMMEDLHGEMPPQEMFLVKPTNYEDTYKDIEKTLGLVPKFFLAFPKEAIAGAWSEFKALQLNPYTSLNGKQKELIGLGVAAQIPCDYCITFHRQAAVLNGATQDEINEAIGVAALTRHWSTLFHGPKMELENFKKDADQMVHSTAQHSLHS